MNHKLIILAGYLAGGKTTFAAHLSRELIIPYFSKDNLKTALNRSIPVRDRTGSKALSAAAFDAIAFITERFMETGKPLIIEANFVMKENHNGLREGEALKALAERYAYETLTYLFKGDLPALYQRFISREETAERSKANQLWSTPSYEDFAVAVIPLGDFSAGGQTIIIDATDFSKVDYESHIQTARIFMA